MADAAVEFLLENLKQLPRHADPIPDEAEKLESHLRQFKAFLKIASKQRREEEEVTELTRCIRSAVYEAGDIIDAYVTQAAVAKNKNYFQGAIGGQPNIITIIQQFESIIQKIDYIYSHNSMVVDFAQIKFEEGKTNEEKIQ